ncbi:MAG: class I SAM-dependent methyltransferase, partial [Gammaproteobacteria bacterium]
MNPVYSNEYLNQYYAEYYTGGETSADIDAGQQRTNLIKLRAIEKFIKQPGRVLDFGCGNGNFIRTAQEKGWQVTGYDVDCDAMQHVASRYAVEVGCGNLHDLDWPEKQFDLIHAHHVVEHLKTPVADLQRLNRWLKPGGHFYIGVPNIHAASSRLKFFLEKIGLRRKNIGKYYDSDHHVFYYTPTSLTHLLETCGFEVLMVMNGNKSHVSDSPLVQFFTYYLMNYVYSSSAFFVIARK